MDLKTARREFKKHYKAAMKLKEGGKAWEREIAKALHYQRIGTALYQQKLRERC